MKVREFFSAVAQGLVGEVVLKLLITIFTSGVTYTAFFNLLEKIAIPRGSVILLSISATAMIIFLVLFLYRRLSKKYTPMTKIDSKYKIKEKIVTFEYDGNVSYYTSEQKLQFREKTREYYGKFHWSGSDGVNIQVENKNFKIDILKRRTHFIEYVIVFDRAYKKGSELNLKIVAEMYDYERRFSPYLTTTVITPMDKLTLVLKINTEKYPIKDMEREVIPPNHAHHEDIESIDFKNNIYTWKIKRPENSYQYSLSWVFDY